MSCLNCRHQAILYASNLTHKLSYLIFFLFRSIQSIFSSDFLLSLSFSPTATSWRWRVAKFKVGLIMISNLFSIFDPSSYFLLPLNWLGAVLGIFFITWRFWFSSSRLSIFFNLLGGQLHSEFKVLVGPVASSGHTLLLFSLFTFICLNNFLGLFPYIFTSSSHLVVTLSLAFPFWLRFIIFGWLNHTNHMLAHLVPLGTPGVLMPFMVLIETIRNVIRPGTLAVRLAANIIAGHLLLVLLGNQGPRLTSYFLFLLIGAQILLLILERAVAVIQSYVFAVLTTLYSREVA